MTGEDKFQRILAAAERMRDGLSWFRRWESLSWDDVEEFVTAAVRNPSDQLLLFGFVRREKMAGVPSPAGSPTLKDKLRRCFRQSFETDALSAMGAIQVPHEGNGGFSWKVFERDPLTANLTEGQFVRISGPPGGGKTNLGCVMIHRWMGRGFRAITNIRNIEGAVYAPDIRSLLRGVIAARKENIAWTFWLDEPRIAGYIRQRTMTTRSQDLDKVVTAVRKLGGNMVLIEQMPEAVPALIVAWARSLFYCHEPGYVSIDLRGPTLVWRQDVRDFPATTLTFDTRDFAAFRVDLDVDAMFQEIAGAKDQLTAMLEYVDRPPTIRVRKPNPRDLPRGPMGEFVSSHP